MAPAELAGRLRERNVLISAGRSRRIRLVTHFGIGRPEVEETLQAFEQVMRRV
jgi:threonine aldolase